LKLGFEESKTPYSSGTQKARAWTEAWVSAWAYCPHCGHAKMSQFPNNSPLADFLCTSCSEEFELKSQKGKFGATVADGAYKTKCERIAASNNPNLLLMNYDLKSLAVVNLFIVPKHFFVRDIIEARKPLAHRATCRLDRIEDTAQPRSGIRQNPHRAERLRPSERARAGGVAEDALSTRRIA
jgi:type II restriction enzyme